MLLSIVRCSDCRQFSEKNSVELRKKKLSKNVELIGPVLASSVSAMRNQGGAAAKGQWLFFMDEDCHVKTDRVLDLISKMENKSLVCVSGRYQLKQGNYLQKVYHKIQRQWVLQGLSGDSIDGFKVGFHLLGGALLVKKEVFDKVGGFNENMGWGAEERDFVERLREEGFTTGVSFSLAVVHTNNLNLFGFVKRAWYQNFNGAYYGLKRSSGGRYIEYLRTPLKFLLPTVLFFFLGFMALCSGQVMFELKRIKSLNPFMKGKSYPFSNLSVREMFQRIDVFYVCFDEPSRSENWEQIKSILKKAKKIEGIVGFDEALKTCARRSSTDHFFIIDGDNRILEDRLNSRPQLSEVSDQWILSWSSLNSMNALIYGNGGLKLWPKEVAINIKSHENAGETGDQTDYCFVAKYYMVDDYVTETVVNGTPKQAFRSGFREGVKMSLQWGQQVSLNMENFDSALGKQNRLRLKTWCEVGADVVNGYWAVLGARLGLKMNAIDLFDHQAINSYEWIDNCLFLRVLDPLGLTFEDMGSPGSEKKLIPQINRLGEILNKHLPLELKLLNPDESLSFKKKLLNPKRVGLLEKR